MWFLIMRPEISISLKKNAATAYQITRQDVLRRREYMAIYHKKYERYEISVAL